MRDGGGTKQTERNCMEIAYRMEFRVSSQSTASDETGKHRRRQHRTKPSFINKTFIIIKKREPRKKEHKYCISHPQKEGTYS